MNTDSLRTWVQICVYFLIMSCYLVQVTASCCDHRCNELKKIFLLFSCWVSGYRRLSVRLPQVSECECAWLSFPDINAAEMVSVVLVCVCGWAVCMCVYTTGTWCFCCCCLVRLRLYVLNLTMSWLMSSTLSIRSWRLFSKWLLKEEKCQCVSYKHSFWKW